ncbi:MAG: DsrE family protein [Nitrospirae bacterium]|nr:DsrE family protein [Nitrospirota bacterium]
MNLGILINTDKHVKDIVGLTKAAASKKHEVVLFMMDNGVKLLHNPSITALHKIPGVSMSFCQYSADVLKVSTKKIAKGIAAGSQFNNAEMVKSADKVIVL